MVGKFPFQKSYINRGGYGGGKCFLRVASLYRLPQSRELELRWGFDLSFEILAGPAVDRVVGGTSAAAQVREGTGTCGTAT